MKKPLRPNNEAQEKRKARWDMITAKYKECTSEELKTAFNSKEHNSSTDRDAIVTLARDLMMKERKLNEPIELNETNTDNKETTEDVVGDV